MVKIRLSRTGAKNQSSFRIVVVDSRWKRDGKFLELLGYYRATGKSPVVNFNRDRYQFWLEKGARPSVAVARLAIDPKKEVPEKKNISKKTEVKAKKN